MILLPNCRAYFGACLGGDTAGGEGDPIPADRSSRAYVGPLKVVVEANGIAGPHPQTASSTRVQKRRRANGQLDAGA